LSAQIPTSSSSAGREKPVFKPFVVESASLLDCIQQFEDRTYQSAVIGSVKVIVISPRMVGLDVLNVLTLFLRYSMVSPITFTNQKVGFQQVTFKPHIKVIKYGAENTILLKMDTVGTLLEMPPGLANNAQTLNRIKIALEKQLEEEIMLVVKRLQALNSDPVGFRNILGFTIDYFFKGYHY
jgi:hypothetical protein